MDRTKAGKSIDSHAAHKNIQKSTTLNRRYVHKPSSFTKIKISAGDQAEEQQAQAKKIAINAEADKAQEAEQKALAAAQAAAKAAEEAAKKAAEEQAKLAAAEAELSRLEAAAKAAQEKATQAALNSLQNDTTALAQAQKQAQAKQAEQQQQAQAKKIAIQADTPDLPPAPNPYQAAINRAHKIQVLDKDEPTAAEIKEAAIKKSIAETNATYQPLSKKQLRQMNMQDRMHAEASMKAAQVAQKEMVVKDKKAAKAQAATERQMAKSRKMVAKKLDQDQHITKMQRSMRKASAGKRFLIAFSASAAVVAILGLIVRFNMPDVSVKVAAMQTGIEATYPTYIPRGYQLSSVTSDKENGITMEFGDSDHHTFTINEKKSSWDSNALLNNYVKERWGSDYTALREHGITIYISDGNATWVNGGLVYNLASDTGVLTKKQIKNIVTSL